LKKYAELCLKYDFYDIDLDKLDKDSLEQCEVNYQEWLIENNIRENSKTYTVNDYLMTSIDAETISSATSSNLIKYIDSIVLPFWYYLNGSVSENFRKISEK